MIKLHIINGTQLDSEQENLANKVPITKKTDNDHFS